MDVMAVLVAIATDSVSRLPTTNRQWGRQATG